MSSRVAKEKRLGGEHESYPTPSWCVDRLLEECSLPPGRWLEPSAGDGAIIRAVNARIPDVEWTACEIRREEHAGLEPLCAEVRGDFFDFTPVTRFDVALMNPPYSMASQFIGHALKHADVVVALLRLNYLESERRAAQLRKQMPSEILVLPNRPAFVNGRTDSCAYAWFLWDCVTRSESELVLLNTTSAEERKRA